MRMVFDVDNVLCKPQTDRPYADREPYDCAIKCMQKFHQEGYYLILHTARYMVQCNGNKEEASKRGHWELVNWCNQWKIPFHEIHMGKPSGDIYFDDRAFNINTDFGEEDWINAGIYVSWEQRTYFDVIKAIINPSICIEYLFAIAEGDYDFSKENIELHSCSPENMVRDLALQAIRQRCIATTEKVKKYNPNQYDYFTR